MPSFMQTVASGNLKVVALVVVPAVFIDHIMKVQCWIGIAIFAIALIAYSYISHHDAQEAAIQKALASKAEAAKDAEAGGKPPKETTPLVK